MKAAHYGPKRIKGLLDNYQSLAIVAALLLISFSSLAQYDSTKIRQAQNSYGFDWKNIKVNSSLIIPNDTPRLAYKDSGAVSYKGGSLWVYNGRYWTGISGSGSNPVNDIVIYKENTEWSGYTDIPGGLFNYTTSPYAGTYSTYSPAFSVGQYIEYTAPDTYTATGYDTLRVRIKNLDAFNSSTKYNFRFYNGVDIASSAVTVNTGSYGWDRTISGTYQDVKIPVNSFGFTGPFNKLFIGMSGANSTGFQLDNIILSSGGSNTAYVLDSLMWQTIYKAYTDSIAFRSALSDTAAAIRGDMLTSFTFTQNYNNKLFLLYTNGVLTDSVPSGVKDVYGLGGISVIDSIGNVYISGSGSGSTDTSLIREIVSDSTKRFGIEDNLGLQDRSVDMQGNDFLLNNGSKIDLVSGNYLTGLSLNNTQAGIYATSVIGFSNVNLSGDLGQMFSKTEDENVFAEIKTESTSDITFYRRIDNVTYSQTIGKANGVIPISIQVNGIENFANDSGKIDLGTISGGGTTKYSTTEYGMLTDSATTNLYKFRVDSTVMESQARAVNRAALKQDKITFQNSGNTGERLMWSSGNNLNIKRVIGGSWITATSNADSSLTLGLTQTPVTNQFAANLGERAWVTNLRTDSFKIDKSFVYKGQGVGTNPALSVYNSVNGTIFFAYENGEILNGLTRFRPIQATGGGASISAPAWGVFPTTSTHVGFSLWFASSNTRTITTGTTRTNGSMILNETFAPTSGVADYATLKIGGTKNQTGGANGTTWGLLIDETITAAADYRGLEVGSGKIVFPTTTTTAGTTGAVTINKATGTVNIAAAGTSVVVTNSLVSATSLVRAFVRTDDANKSYVYAVVPAAGSFTIHVTPAPAGEISIGFETINL